MMRAFRSFAYSSALRVRIEYLGKLIPITTSFSFRRIICSNISLASLAVTVITSPRKRFR